MVALLWLAVGVAVAFAGWSVYRRFRADPVAQFIERRRGSSRMVGRGEFVDGNRHLDVALAVSQSTFFYENADMQASLDLEWVREIEYDTELGTGAAVPGRQVLRLRSDSQTFEFVVPGEAVARWRLVLPPRGVMEAAAPLSVAN